MTDAEMRVFEGCLQAALSKVLHGLVQGIAAELRQHAKDAVNAEVQRFADEMHRTANAACDALAAITTVQKEVTEIHETQNNCVFCRQKAANGG